MVRKILDNLGFVGGLLFLISMLLSYFLDLWNVWVQIGVYGGLILIGVYLLAQLPTLIEALGTRGGKKGGAALLSLLLVVGILVLLNFLNYRHHERWDLSENNLFSLSDQSLKVASNLDRDVEVVAFFENRAGAEQFENLMKEYQFASPRVSYEVVDPQKDPAKVQQYQVERNGQIVVKAGEKTQKIDAIQEQELTNALIKVTRDEEKTVYFLSGHGERSIDSPEPDGYLAVKAAVEQQNYRVEKLNLAVDGEIPEDASLLVMAGVRSQPLPGELEALDAYLAGGGKLLLMLEPDTDADLSEYLARYGVAVYDDMVLDPSPVGQLLGLGPVSPLVGSYRPHPITDGFEYSTFFPTVRSLDTTDSSLGYRSQALFSTSGRAWGETELTPGQPARLDDGKDRPGPVPLAVVSVLEPEEDDVGGDVPEEIEEEKPKKPESRLLVVGDSDFVANRYVEAASGNLDMFLNMASWLLQDEDLIAVRPKDPTDRKVVLTARESSILYWGLVVFLPVATLVLGIGIWYRRR